MIEQNVTGSPLSSEELIHMIQQFVNCLNYPKTKQSLALEKQKKNKITEPNHNHNANKQTNTVEKMNVQQRQKQEQKNDMIGKMQQHSAQHNQQKKQTKIQEELPNGSARKIQQFKWKPKYYSKFATFSEIVCCLQTSAAQRQIANSKIIQAEVKSTNNEVLQRALNQRPCILNLFSAFDTATKVKQFMIPIYRNLSIEPKFSKPTKSIAVSPKQNLMIILDEQATMIIVNLNENFIIQFMRSQESEQVSCIQWLKNGIQVAVGTASGKLTIYNAALNKSLQQVASLRPHQDQIVSMYCNRDYLYTCGADYKITRIKIKLWKIQQCTSLKGNWLSKMTKIQHKKLKDVIFGVEKQKKQLLMIDQITGYQTVIFSIKNDHINQCRKLCQKKQQKIKTNYFTKNCWISNIIANPDNSTLIVSVSGINPSIYQIDPLRNQCTLRLNFKNLKTSFYSLGQFEGSNAKSAANINMELSHKSQILVVTTNSNSIFYIRLKNWRILHQYVESQKNMSFGQIGCTKRYPELEQLSLFQYTEMQVQASRKNNKKSINEQKSEVGPEKQSIICLVNNQNSCVQIYSNEKGNLKTIRSQIIRLRPQLPHSFGLAPGAEGFLQLLQSIRENYQGLV